MRKKSGTDNLWFSPGSMSTIVAGSKQQGRRRRQCTASWSYQQVDQKTARWGKVSSAVALIDGATMLCLSGALSDGGLGVQESAIDVVVAAATATR